MIDDVLGDERKGDDGQNADYAPKEEPFEMVLLGDEEAHEGWGL